MNNDRKYLRIGIFVFAAAGLLVATLLFFGGGRFFSPRVGFETYVKGSVQGIDIGSPVKFRGVAIGRVRDVTFVFNEYPGEQDSGYYNYVCLIMEVTKQVFPGMFSHNIEEQIRQAVKNGLRARIEPQGITGLNYIEIDYVDPAQHPPLEIDWTPRSYYIPSAPGQLTSILDSVNKIMLDIQNFHLQEIGNQTVTLLQGLNRTVEDANLKEVSADARRLINELDVLVREAKLPELSAATRNALDEVASAVSDLKAILANIEPSTRLNSDDINATLANFRIISDNLRVLSGDLRRYPSKLFFGGPPPHPSVAGVPTASPTPAPREKPKRRQ